MALSPFKRWLFGLAAAAIGCSVLFLVRVPPDPGAPQAAAPGDGQPDDSTDATTVVAVRPSHPATATPSAHPKTAVPPAVPGPVPPPVPASSRPEVQPATAPLANKDLLEKAGEKDGDTTYTRLVDQALEVVPRLTDDERGTLRAIAYKRQARLKLALHQQPSTAGAPATIEDDNLSAFERDLLGAERYREYQAALTDLLDH
jgi:hypothetical protein